MASELVVPLEGCLRFLDAEDELLPAFGFAEKVDVPGIASFPEPELVPFVVAWPFRVLTPDALSLPAAGAPLLLLLLL